MAIITPTPADSLPPHPSRGDDAANFRSEADAFVAALPTFGTQLNSLADNVYNNAGEAETAAGAAASSAVDATNNGAAQVTLAAAQVALATTEADRATTEADRAEAVADNVTGNLNFKGNWSDQTGAANVPYSVYHNGVYWQLLTNIADVTLSEPSTTNTDWAASSGAPLAQFSKSMVANEIRTIDLTNAVTTPSVSVMKEVAQVNQTNSNWDVDVNVNDYVLDEGLLLSGAGVSPDLYTRDEILFASNLKLVQDTSTQPHAVVFSPDGLTMLVGSGNSTTVRQYDLKVAFDISTSYLNGGVLLNAANSQIKSLKFNNDGTRLFAFGLSGNTINAYDLTTPYSIAGTSLQASLNVASQTTTGAGIAFKADGTKMYVTSQTSGGIYEYDLSIAWDITSAVYNTFYTIATNTPNSDDLTFKADGTKLFVMNLNTSEIHSYSLSTAWDLSTLSYDGSPFSVLHANSLNSYKGLWVSDDGTNMYVAGHWSYSASNIYAVRRYNLSTGWDLSTASYTDDSKSLDVTSNGANSYTGGRFADNGNKLFLVRLGVVIQYSLSTPYDVSTGTFDKNCNASAQIGSGGNTADIEFDPTGTKMFLASAANTNIYQYSLSTPWDVGSVSLTSTTSHGHSNMVSFGFSSDGLTFWTMNINGQVQVRPLSTAWTTSTLGAVSETSSPFPFGTAAKLRMAPNGVDGLIWRGTSDIVYDIKLASPLTFTGATVPATSYQSCAFWGSNVYVADIAANGTTVIGMSSNDGIIRSIELPEANRLFKYDYWNKYLTLVTNDSGQIDTNYWTDFNSMAVTQSLSSPNELYYSFSVDGRTTFKVVKNGQGSRNIVRDNAGTWEYNSNTDYGSETWTVASVNTLSGALADAVVSVMVPSKINSATYLDSFSFASQSADPTGMCFNNDGTKMFMVDTTSDNLFQYSLSTPYDVATATYDSVTFHVGTQAAFPQAIQFNGDGTKLYVLNASGSSDYIYVYNLPTPYILTGMSYSGVFFSVAAQTSEPSSFCFSADGTKMLVASRTTGNTLFEYDLTIPFDVTSATYNGNSFAAFSYCEGVCFSHDGMSLFYLTASTTNIYQYDLVAPYTIAGMTGSSVILDESTRNLTPQEIIVADGNKVFLLSKTGSPLDAVHRYELPYVSGNAMDEAQLESAGDADFPAVDTTLDFATTFYRANNGSVGFQAASVNYDTNTVDQKAINGTDYRVAQTGQQKLEFKALTAGNYKVRVI